MTLVENGRPRKGRVFLVGAGPGDPELLTLRALGILKTADAVLHDDLVSEEILDLVHTRRVENVGKRCGTKHMSQAAINERMIQLARDGFVVARLKNGDPLVFGRAGEEMDALGEAGIDFEVVPGITAALSAAASARIALTDRRVASELMFISAHHAKKESQLPRAVWGNVQTTLAIHMPGSDYRTLVQDLRDSGRSLNTPCLIVSNATRTAERMLVTTLENLPQAHKFCSPTIVVVGHVAAGAAKLAK